MCLGVGNTSDRIFLNGIGKVYIIIEEISMESEKSIKITITNKDKIFNVRKLPYKQFDNQKYLKQNYSPLHSKKISHNPSDINLLRTSNGCPSNNTNMEYHYQLTLTSSTAYKELQQKYREVKEIQRKEKEEKLKILKQKEEELQKYIKQQRRLEDQQERLFQKKQQICQYINRIRQRKQQILQQQQHPQQFQVVDVEYFREMMMSMQYQGGLDINPDNMTYQELLQLQQKIGKVSKGINEQQYKLLGKAKALKEDQNQLCSICYQNLKQGQQINKLPCKHIFHCQCIKQWLLKQKVCPMCKQELKISSTPSQIQPQQK